MSMKNYGCVGFVIPANQLTKLFYKDVQEHYIKLLDEEDVEELKVFTDSNLPNNFPKPNSFFRFNSDEHESEDLTEDGIYALFDEEDLYIKTPSPKLEELRDAGVEPEHSTWVTWG
jgi:hypothetical protein